MKKRIYEIIQMGHKGDRASSIYDIFMIVVILLSIVPLMFMKVYPIFDVIEKVTVVIFIIDYLLRWWTADLRLKEGGWSYVYYPFTRWAIIDLLSILPGLNLIGDGFKIFRVARLLRILRLLKLFRYSDAVQVLVSVIRKERKVLMAVLGISVFYIFLTALIMFNTEPRINPDTGQETFTCFFDALYWSTVTLTTVGYGDLIPVTEIGRLVGMLSSLVGVAIIALPSGVITASYLEEIRSAKKRKEEDLEENAKEIEEEKDFHSVLDES
ncbi:MAG: ion transporter [Bacteroidales bacterium]|nr:ion transporter [Bacteroidales bacterium]